MLIPSSSFVNNHLSFPFDDVEVAMIRIKIGLVIMSKIQFYDYLVFSDQHQDSPVSESLSTIIRTVNKQNGTLD